MEASLFCVNVLSMQGISEQESGIFSRPYLISMFSVIAWNLREAWLKGTLHNIFERKNTDFWF